MSTPPALLSSAGVLAGLRVLELESVGPVPLCGMLFADHGADVLLVDRREDAGLGFGRERAFDLMLRGRRSIALDLKAPADRDTLLALVERADALIEGFRPGVLERLGLGPDVLHARNPRLVVGRMTGWGQAGPLAERAGHDIDYVALSGALHAIGPADAPPPPPLNFVGDFGGGGMLLAFGVLAGVLEARSSGRGQVVDAAMVDGAALLGTMFHGMAAAGRWQEARGANVLDGAAPWYRCYATADGRFMAVGAIEPRFYAALLERLGLAGEALPAQHDRAGWPALAARFAQAFATRTRDAWAAHFAGSDACVAPVLSFAESVRHPHAVARDAYVQPGGVVQPAAAPRFSRTPGAAGAAPPARDADREAILRDWGVPPASAGRGAPG